MKYSIGIPISLIITLTFMSCKNNAKDTSREIETSKTMYSLSISDVITENDFSEIMCLEKIDDTVFVFGKLADNNYGGFASDTGMKNCNGFTFETDENENVVTAAQITKDDKAILTYKDENAYIHVFDGDGKESNLIECNDILSDGYENVKMAATEGDYIIIADNETVYSVDADTSDIVEVNLNNKDIFGLTKNSDNVPIIMFSDIEGDISVAEIIDGELKNEVSCNNMSSSALAICSGFREYSLIGVFYDAMYGLKENDWIKLWDFSKMDFKTYDIQGIVMTSDTSYILGIHNNGRILLKQMTVSMAPEVSNPEKTEKEVVKVAVFGIDPVLDGIIKRYNNSNPHYRVETVDYGHNSKEIYDALKIDMVSGNSPDVIPKNININPDSAYADLYEFIDNDSDFSRDKFIPNILDSMEINGRLPIISPAFKIETVFAKSKYPYITENQSYDDFIEAYNSKPDNMDFFYQWNEQLFENNFLKCIVLSDYVDYETAECDFDSNDFISFLIFFKENHIGLTENESTGVFLTDSIGNPMAISQDKQLFSIKTLNGMNSIWAEINGEFKNEKMTIAGIPSLNGCGSYAVPTEFELSIPANAPNKEGGWDFIKWFFSDEISKQYYRTEFSIIKEIFERNADKCLVNDPENVDMVYNTDDKEPTEVYYTNNELTDYFILEPMTESEIEQYTQYVYNSVKTYIRQDNNLYWIINQEIERYFNDEISAEEAAKIIQGRASIYLSEQYQ